MRGFWRNEGSDSLLQREFLEVLILSLPNMRVPLDLRKLTQNQIREGGGASLLLVHFENRVEKLTATLFPELCKTGLKNHHADFVYYKPPPSPISRLLNDGNRIVLDDFLARSFLFFIMESCSFYSPSDLYAISQESYHAYYSIVENLIFMYSSVVDYVTTVMPEIIFDSSRFIGESIFGSKGKDRAKLIEIFVKLSFSVPTDFYSIAAHHLRSIKVTNNPCELIYRNFPELHWLLWKFCNLPSSFWDKIENQRCFFDWLFHKLKLTSLESWRNIDVEEIKRNGGYAFLHRYNYDIMSAVMSVYSYPSCTSFSHPSEQHYGYHRKNFFTLVSKLNNILLDWYTIPLKILLKSRQKDFSLTFERFGNSLFKMVSSLICEVQWQFWRFSPIPLVWSDLRNQLFYLNWLENELGIVDRSEWYDIPTSSFKYGEGLLYLYDNSVSQILMSIFSHHPWDISKFKSNSSLIQNRKIEDEVVGRGRGSQSLPTTFQHLALKLGIKKLQEWNRISIKQIRDNGGKEISKRSIFQSQLIKYYPHHKWNFAERRIKASQRWLKIKLEDRFPRTEIIEDYLHTDINNPNTTKTLEIDLYLPSKALAFEYQGIHHFNTVFLFQEQMGYHTRDSIKRSMTSSSGMTLISVPYLWDSGRSAKETDFLLLSHTIHTLRPDLLPLNYSSPPSITY